MEIRGGGGCRHPLPSRLFYYSYIIHISKHKKIIIIINLLFLSPFSSLCFYNWSNYLKCFHLPGQINVLWKHLQETSATPKSLIPHIQHAINPALGFKTRMTSSISRDAQWKWRQAHKLIELFSGCLVAMKSFKRSLSITRNLMSLMALLDRLA